MIDYSIGFTQAEVEAILAANKAELSKVQIAYASDGSSVTKRRLEDIHAIIAACQRALMKLAPVTYPAPVVRVGQAQMLRSPGL